MAHTEERVVLVDDNDQTGPASMFARVVYFIMNILEIILVLRFVFRALGADAAAGFVQFIYALTDPLAAPFRGIIASTAANGAGIIEWSSLMAMIVYALAAVLLVQLVRILTPVHHH